jgi:hypothetical protein
MMNAKDAKATALAVVTFLIRPSLFLIFGLAIGYGIGFVDAFRQSDTLGDKVARVVFKMHPEALSAGVAERATAIKNLKDAKMGVTDTTTPPPDITIPPGF